MFNELNKIEISWVQFIQDHLSSDLGDLFFIQITNLNKSVPLSLLFLFLILGLFIKIKGLKQGITYFFASALTIGFCDFLGFQLFKNIFMRQRPFEFSDSIVGKVAAHGSSFISNHSANNMALAVLTVYFLGVKPGRVFLIWALLIGFSRIYCGVHFPSDVVCGWLWGFIVAKLFIQIHMRLMQRKSA